MLVEEGGIRLIVEVCVFAELVFTVSSCDEVAVRLCSDESDEGSSKGVLLYKVHPPIPAAIANVATMIITCENPFWFIVKNYGTRHSVSSVVTQTQ